MQWWTLVNFLILHMHYSVGSAPFDVAMKHHLSATSGHIVMLWTYHWYCVVTHWGNGTGGELLYLSERMCWSYEKCLSISISFSHCLYTQSLNESHSHTNELMIDYMDSGSVLVADLPSIRSIACIYNVLNAYITLRHTFRLAESAQSFGECYFIIPVFNGEYLY
eukprot:833540_1